MNSKVLYFLSFVMGASVGSFVTWKFVEKKYKQIAQEEIDSVKERFLAMRSEHKEPEENDKMVETVNKDRTAYLSAITDLGYSNNSDINEKGGDSMMDKPYIISPDEFGEFDDYETISLTYYADGVLTDEYNEIVDDVDNIVGEDSLTHFGEYEDDSVFVRNDSMKSDYEILLDVRNYDESLYQVED